MTTTSSPQSKLPCAAHPRVRWQESCDISISDEEIKEILSNWPPHWWGTANAWLVFLGPGPGISGEIRRYSDLEKMPCVGKAHPHFMNEQDSAGFWERMRQWTVESFRLAGVFDTDCDAAIGSSLVANVTDIHAGKASDIPTNILQERIGATIDNLEIVRPRIVVTLEKRVSELLIDEFCRRSAKIVFGPMEDKVPAKNKLYPYYKPKQWFLETHFGALTIAESPQHPSRSKYYDRLTVDRYLAKIIRSSI